eukprot:CAMPEP_0183342900 /NCGR_PEP_ID=MMETSP0164_2-20130417/8919_1 /TAXON_ID=221442 /ORGANISM="Coccolithus pelagicus ssp braarudi, Strain PLY182g" /LENGTH=71 /DNA_ID=CAMNT_0025513613 /DNA_START=101 /DNA_END=316 /DNA_ORIENTATION=-
MAVMRLPTMTPMGTTYDWVPLSDWIERERRYPANEAPGSLTLEELTPNRAVRNMIERWLAVRNRNMHAHAA